MNEQQCPALIKPQRLLTVFEARKKLHRKNHHVPNAIVHYKETSMGRTPLLIG